MSDQDKNSIQRFGRHNRKHNLPRPQSLFPPEDENKVEPESPSEEISEPVDDSAIPAFDLESLALPDTNNDAIESLAKLSKEDVRAPIITPQTERYPPLNPADLIQDEKPEAEKPEQEVKPQHNLRDNFITVLAVIGTILFVIWFGVVWVDPQTAWNPFPPATPFVIITATPGQAEPNPMLPTVNADGQIFIVATDAPTPTLSATDSPYPFIVPNPVTYAPNTNDLGCNWWSIAGTVTDEIGLGVNGYRVQIIGDGINETVFTGTGQAFGDGGFELPLIGTPQVAEFTVQLFDPESTPQSQPFTVTTQSDCSTNVAIINFVRNQ